MRPFFFRRSQLLAGACLGFSLSSCVLGFDAEVPLFDDEADGAEDIAGRDDASDAVGDVSADAREDGGPDRPDSGNDVASDGGMAPMVTVTAPSEGEYTVGRALEIVWVASNADAVLLSLVNPERCSTDADGVIVPTIANVEAATGRFSWDVPVNVAVGSYRIRAIVSSGVAETAGCSPPFTLVQPPSCDALDCPAQNRACDTTTAPPRCGGCVEGFVDAADTCVAVDCGLLSAPVNATVSTPDGTLFGATATYSCNAGFALTGTPTRRCESSGSWSGSEPGCAATSCGAVATVANATAAVPGRTTGSTATFSCESGYTQRSGTVNTQTCNGSSWGWTGPVLVCDAVSCGALSNPANGSVSTPTGTDFNDVATYSCATGYTDIIGSTTRTCLASGSWSGSAVVCNPVDCGTPPTISNGNRAFTSTTFASTASYSCNSGYIRTGSTTVICDDGGRWGTPPTCSDSDECALGAVCGATGNACTNTMGSWQCSCTEGYTGATVTGADARCTLEPAGLGDACVVDSQCPVNSWCSSVSSYRRCSPRAFGDAEHRMDFVFVPAGTFQQGTPGATNEERPYTATISRNYFVSRTEVTQGQWTAATGGINPSCFQSTTSATCSSNNANPNGPLQQADWYSALAYANWLSVSQGLAPCYTLVECTDPTNGWHDGAHSGCTGASFVGLTCTGYRLLTESEWERAARGGTTSAYYWGDASDVTTVGLYAWFNGNSTNRIQSVGAKQANAYGLFDMSGNVWEWVWDWVWRPGELEGFHHYPIGSATDYLGPATGASRGLRGGSWNYDPFFLRSAVRIDFGFPSTQWDLAGIRLARTANE